jgi:uncharacterized phiE125 gp8 family phage protein
MIHLQTTRALITPPTDAVVPLADVKAHLRVDTDDDDGLISAMIGAAAGMLDPAAGGALGRALRPQTWELRRSSFYDFRRQHEHLASEWSWRWPIALPYPPLIEVGSVKYVDVNGATQILTEDVDFRIIGSGGLGKCELQPPFGKSWPSARWDAESVIIRYQSGYARPDGDAVDPLPAPVKQWLLLVVGAFYENREMFVAGASSAAMIKLPDYIEALTAPYRVY